jgi:hypothetical protein
MRRLRTLCFVSMIPLCLAGAMSTAAAQGMMPTGPSGKVATDYASPGHIKARAGIVFGQRGPSMDGFDLSLQVQPFRQRDASYRGVYVAARATFDPIGDFSSYGRLGAVLGYTIEYPRRPSVFQAGIGGGVTVDKWEFTEDEGVIEYNGWGTGIVTRPFVRAFVFELSVPVEVGYTGATHQSYVSVGINLGLSLF